MTRAITRRRRGGLALSLGAALALGLMASATPAQAVVAGDEAAGVDYSAEPLPTSLNVNGCRTTQQWYRPGIINGENHGLELRACEPGYLLDTVQGRQTSVPESRTGAPSRIPLVYQLPAGVYNFPINYFCEGTNVDPACGYAAQAFVMWTWVPSRQECPKALPPGRSFRDLTLSGINWSVTAPPQVQQFTGADGSQWSLMVEKGVTEIGLSSNSGNSSPYTAWRRYDSTLAFDTAGRGEQSLCARTGMRLKVTGGRSWMLFGFDRRIDVLGGISQTGPDYRPRVPSLTAVGGSTLSQDGSWSVNTTLFTLNNISDPNAIQARELRFRYVKADPPTSTDGKLNGGGCRPGDAPGSDLYTIDLKQRAQSRGVSAANSIAVVEKRSDRVVPNDATYLCAYQYLRTSGAQEHTSISAWLKLTPKSPVDTVVTNLPKLTVTQATAKLATLSTSLTAALARPVVDQAEIDRLRREAAEAAEQAQQAAAEATQQQADPQQGPGVASPPANADLDLLLDRLGTFEDLQQKVEETRTPLQTVTGIDPTRTPIYPRGATSTSGMKITVGTAPSVKAGSKPKVRVKVLPGKWAGTSTVYLIRKVDGTPVLISTSAKKIGPKGGIVTLTVPKTAQAGKYQVLTTFAPRSTGISGVASFTPITVRR